MAVEKGHGWRNRLRALAAALLVIIGCLAFSAYVVVHWAERQILNTDNWVALVSPLPKQPVVATALGGYISDQVFQNVAVEEKITNALPPQAGFLAGPLAGQLKTLTTRAAQKLVASDAFQAIWAGANRIAMDRLLAQARGQTPPLQAKINEKFNINLSDSSGKLRDALGSAANAIPALQPAANKAVTISTDLRSRPRRLQQYVKTTDNLAAILPMLTIASLLGALALSSWRRRTTLIIVLSIILLMLVELVAVKWLRQETLNQVHNSANLSAVSYIYDALVGWLKNMIYVVLGIMAVLAAVLLLAGPAKWAESARSYVHIEKIRDSRVMATWRSTRLWIKKREYYLWLAVIVIVLAGLALVDTITGRTVANAVLLTLSLFALLHIVASPSRPRRLQG